jgi:hypothetical protein
MLRSQRLAAVLSLTWLAGCGPPQAPAASPEAGQAPPEGSSAASGEASGAAEAGSSAAKGAGTPEGAAEGAPSEATSLARDFLKSGGRRIGYSASKKGFLYPLETRQKNGFSLDIYFLGEDGNPKDPTRVCQVGECEERLDEISKDLAPKLASRLETEGYVSLRGIGWPSGRDELEVSSLGMKLHYKKGQLSGSQEGKPKVALAPVGKRLDAQELLAVFVVPDRKLLAVLAAPGGGAKGVVQELYLVKLP